MRATIKDLGELVQNPPPGFSQVFNGRPAYDRLKDAHEQATKRMRRKQVERYDSVRKQAAELISEDAEAVEEVLKAVRSLKQDLKRGLVSPDQVMQKVAASMRGADELVAHVRQVQDDEEAATAMIDTSPDDYEQELLERFPALPAPTLTEEFLRGEAESPFRDGDGA